jgi:hypothetical protein
MRVASLVEGRPGAVAQILMDWRQGSWRAARNRSIVVDEGVIRCPAEEERKKR